MVDRTGISTEVDQALAGGAPQRVGWFRFYFDDQRWEWSEQVHRMHGYEPGMVNPTTELVLSHKHPADRQQVATTIDDIVRTHHAFSTRHRIIDVAGVVRHMIVVGDELYDDAGTTVIGTHGFYIDVTSSEEAHQEAISVAVEEFTQSRAGIEQAKGVLMMVYGITDGAAFELLKWLSQQANVKVRLLAQQIVKDFAAEFQRAVASSQLAFDQTLLTAHQRIGQQVDAVGSDAGSGR